MMFCVLQLPVADPFLEKVSIADLGELRHYITLEKSY
jgi:hypothetical protein